MKMKKSIISLLLVVSTLFTVSSPALAAYFEPIPQTGSSSTNTEFRETSFFYEGELIPIRYRIENGMVSYAEIGDSIMQSSDGKVYLDGELVATITADDSMRRTGWLYSDQCPYGFEPSDFSEYFGTDYHNISFKKAVTEITINVIIAALLAAFPFDDAVGGQALLKDVAEEIFEGIMDYEMNPKVYVVEDIYKIPNIGYTHKNILNFYSDSAHTDWIREEVAYSSWA